MSKAQRIGYRHGGLVAGPAVGTYISSHAPDTPGNELSQSETAIKPKTRPQYQTRRRQSVRNVCGYANQSNFDKRGRRSRVRYS